MKKSTSAVMKALLLTSGVVAFAVTARATSQSGLDWNEQYRSQYEIPLGIYTGRSPYMQGAPMVKAAPAPKPAPPPAPAPAPPPPKTGCSDPTWGLIRMTKTMPPEATLGQEFMAQLNLTAQACAAIVVVRDTVPDNASYVRSEPPAKVEGNQLVWRFETMEAGESKVIKIWLRPEKEGTIVNCASVRAEPRTCAATFVGKPVIAIEKNGPATALLGADVAYNMVVKNTGSAVARNVVVTDPVPQGFSHSSGQRELTFNVGDLNPGQSKPLSVTFKANQRGRICNVATASSSNAGKVSAEACTLIQQPGLKIEKSTTDKELLINRTATYAIVVSNTGDVPLTSVVVSDVAAAQTSIVSAEGGSVSGNTATWNVGQLGVGEKKTLGLKIASKTPGRFCNTASVTTAQGLKGSSEACTEWIGVSGVLVEVVDDPDPIQIGEQTTFTIRVTNQGATLALEDVKVKSAFAAELDPLTASSGGTVGGKTVTFPTVPTLAPKASVTYTITAKGVKAGDHRMQTDVTTKGRTSPITELESTTVY